MKRFKWIAAFVILILLLKVVLSTASASAHPQQACWGQATKVFAQMEDMGEHASQQPTPRAGLRNLARALHEQGGIEDDTLQALGAFVAAELGLSIDACINGD